MKYAITGHTSGFGYQLHKLTDSMGFSRHNGFDINKKEDRKRIIDASHNCDIFVNNAYDKYGQIDLLYDVYDAWKDKPKLIVTIGSLASNAAEWRLRPCLYSTVKKALDVATYQLINSHDRQGCKLMIFKPGYMGTGQNQIDFHYAAKFLINAIDNNLHETTEIVLRP